ncbi:MAG: hypothetical protein ABI791_08730 [Acidobacteriota bacterium]
MFELVHLMKLCISFLALAVSLSEFASTPSAQKLNTSPPPTEVSVQSWNKGTASIVGQDINIVLSSKNKTYKKEITGESGEKLLLDIVHNPYDELDLAHWQVRLFLGSSQSGPDMLAVDKNEPGKHYFQQGDSVGVLYPRLEPIVYSDKGEPMYGDGYDFYFIKTVRKIHIQDFVLVLSVGNIRLNAKNPHRVDAMELNIQFVPKPQ